MAINSKAKGGRGGRMNKCGSCQWLVMADGKPYYCAIKDLYTIKDKQDEGCEDFLEADDGQRKSH